MHAWVRVNTTYDNNTYRHYFMYWALFLLIEIHFADNNCTKKVLLLTFNNPMNSGLLLVNMVNKTNLTASENNKLRYTVFVNWNFRSRQMILISVCRFLSCLNFHFFWALSGLLTANLRFKIHSWWQRLRKQSKVHLVVVLVLVHIFWEHYHGFNPLPLDYVLCRIKVPENLMLLVRGEKHKLYIYFFKVKTLKTFNLMLSCSYVPVTL